MASRFSQASGAGTNLGAAYGSVDLDAAPAVRAAGQAARAIASIGGAATSTAGGGLHALGSALGSLAGVARATALGVAGVGVALGGGLAVGVNQARDFEAAISGIAAVAGASRDEITQLRDVALRLGKETSFTAREAAAGIEALVKGGVNVQQILGGAARATLDLAAAGGVSLPEAAQIAANAMSVFGISGERLAGVVDQIAGAANASTIDVRDFALSMQQAGAVVNTVGLGMADLTTAIALLGSKGLRSSDAGTSLKTFLLNLQPSTKAASQAMQRLGIVTADGANAFFTAEGKARSLAEIAEVLRRATSRLTQAQKLQALETIFGTDAIRAAAIFAESGAEGFDAMASAIGKVAAADVARVRLDNLNGSLEQLRGSAEVLGIRLGALFVPLARSGVDAATARLNGLIGVLERVEQVAPDLGPAVGQAFARLGDAGADVGRLQGVLNAVFGEGSALATGVPRLLGALTSLGTGGVAAVERFERAVGLTNRPLSGLVAGLGELVAATAQRIFPANTDQEIKAVGSGMEQLRRSAALAQTPVERVVAILGDLVTKVRTSPEIARLEEAFTRLGNAVGPLVTSLVTLVGVFVKPFIPAGAAGDADGLATALTTIGQPGGPADNASRVLGAVRAAADGIATGVNLAAGGLERLAGWLGEVARQTEAAGAVTRLKEALAGLKEALAPVTGGLFAGLVAPQADREIKTVGRGVAALEKGAQLDETQQAAAGAATALTRALDGVATAVRSLRVAIEESSGFLDKLNEKLRDTGEGDQAATAVTHLGTALLNLSLAPFDGIAKGLSNVNESAGSDNVTRAARALGVLAGVATLTAGVLDLTAAAIERISFFVGKHIAALERLTKGDLAGALAELGTAVLALNVTQGKEFEPDKLIDQSSFERLKGDVQGVIDLIEKLSSAPDDFLKSRAARPLTVKATLDDSEARTKAAALIAHIASMPSTFTVTAYVDTSPARHSLLELSRMLPHSPAEAGPLAFEPDWSYLTANLPDVLGALVRLVTDAGERIGGQAQVEHFQGVASALSAAAAAVGATVEQTRRVAGFVAPAAGELDAVADVLGEVLARVNALAGAFSSGQAERIQQVSAAASSALGALGAAVETLAKVRSFTGPAIGRVQDAVDHMAGLLARLDLLGQGFNPAQLARVKLVGEATAAAMGGLGAALEPLTKTVTFVGPAIGRVVDVIDHISGVLVRLDQLGRAFTADQIGRARALGEAVSAAMGGLGAAVEALAAARDFRAFDPGLFEGLFSLISNVAVRTRDLSLAFDDEQVTRARELADAVRAAFGALGEALEVLPRLAGADLPDVDAALARLLAIIERTVRGIDHVQSLVGQEAARRAGEFADDAGRVVGLLGQGVDAFARLGELQEVSDAQIARFGAGVASAVRSLAAVSRDVAGLLTKEAVRFAEDAGKALGLLGAAASLAQLNEFVAPSQRQFQRFFAALSVAVDGLVAEARRTAPEIARRTGEVGEQLGRALGGVGTAIQTFLALNDFQPGKGFQAKIAGVLDLVRSTVEQMRGLASAFGDTSAVDRFSRTVETMARALSALLATLAQAAETKGLKDLSGLLAQLGGAVAPILARTEHNININFAGTIRAEGFTGQDQRVAGQVSDVVKDEIIAGAVAAVREASVVAFGVAA